MFHVALPRIPAKNSFQQDQKQLRHLILFLGQGEDHQNVTSQLVRNKLHYNINVFKNFVFIRLYSL